MATIPEMLAMLDGIEGMDELRGALTEYGTVEEGANARIAELTEQLAEAERKYTATAAQNYELLMSATGNAGNPAGNEGEGENPGPDPDEALDELIVKED